MPFVGRAATHDRLTAVMAWENSTESADLELGQGSGQWGSDYVAIDRGVVSDLKVIWGEIQSIIELSRSSVGVAGQSPSANHRGVGGV